MSGMMEERLYPQKGQKKDDSERIQNAVDRISLAGGGRVILTSGSYLSGTVCLKDGVTLYLERGAILLGSGRIEDYPDNETCFEDAVGQKRGRALLYAGNSSRIGIEGEGIICGRGECFPPEHPDHLIRPFLIRFTGCRNVTVRGVSLWRSAAWCLHLLDCEEVRIEDVDIVNRCNKNNDGIDIDGCRNVKVSGCRIDSGDDALCLKTTTRRPCRGIRISDCLMTTDWAAFKIGTESAGDFEDIELSDCTFFDGNGCGIKIVPVDGGNVDGVSIHDIRMIHCTGPIFLASGRRMRSYFANEEGAKMPGTIRNVRISRVEADVVSAAGGIYQGKPWGNARGCVVLSGLKEYPMENIEICDCRFDMPGGFAEIPAGPVPELGTEYPEFHMFDPLPASGLYVRHGKNIRLHGNQITWKKSDVRQETVLEDVDGYEGPEDGTEGEKV